MFEVDELFDLTKEGAFNTLQEFKDFAAAASLEDIYSILKPGAFKTPEELNSLLKKKDGTELQLPGGSLEPQELDTSSQDEIIDSELEEVIVPSQTSVRAKTRQSDLERIEDQEIQLDSNEPLQPVAKSVRAEVRKNDIASIEPRKKKDSETIEKKKAVLDLALVLPTLQYDKLDLQNQSFVSSLSTKFGITNEELLEEVKEKRNSTAKASKFQAYKNLFNLSDATIGEGILSIPSALYEVGAMISDPVNRALGLKETNLEAFEEALGTKKAIQSLVEEQEYREKQSALYRKENKIEGGLSENFFGEGNIQDGFYLLGESIAASMPVTLGIMAAAFSGVGTIPLAVGATAVMTGPELRKQKEEFPEQSKAENVLKAIGMAGSEMVFSTISQGTLGRVYKDIIFREGAKQGAKTFRTGLISMYETALKKTGPLAAGTGEGIEEVATQITQNLINGKPVFQGVPDAFIAGVGSGTAYGSPILAIKGGRSVKKYVKEEVLKNNIRTKLKPTEYSDIVNAFNSTDIKEIQFDLLSLKGAKEILENELKRRVGRDEMTQEDADRINQNFFDASTYEAKLRPLDLTQSQLVQATNLLKEKESLDKVIKQVGDPSLTKAQQNRVDEINQELVKLVTITETTKTEEDANTIKSPVKVPEGQQPEVGGTVVEGDNKSTKPARETTQAKTQKTIESTQEGEAEVEISESEEVVIEEGKPLTLNENKQVFTPVRDPKTPIEKKKKFFENIIQKLKAKGEIATRTVKSLIKEVNSLTYDNPALVERAISRITKTFEKANNLEALNAAEKIKNKIKNAVKGKSVDPYVSVAAKQFLLIDPLMVDSLTEYQKKADELLKGLRPSRFTSKTLKVAPAVDVKSTDEYTAKQLEAQKKAQEELDAKVQAITLEALTGKTSSELSLSDVRKESEEEKAEKKKKIIFEALKQAFTEVKSIAKAQLKSGINSITGEKINYSREDVNLVNAFANMNLEKLTPQEAKRAIDSLVNFSTNGTTSGMSGVVSTYIGRRNAEIDKKNGLVSKPPTIIRKLLQIYGEYISSVNINAEFIFIGQSKVRKFLKSSGYQNIVNGVAKAGADVEKISREYYDKFQRPSVSEFAAGKTKTMPNGEAFNTAKNNGERAILARIRRTFVGTETEQKAEFDRQKTLIFDSISRLNEGGGKEAELSVLYQELYDKLLKNSNSISEVEAKADKINLSAVEFITEKWSSFFPDLKKTNLNVYNKLLDEDINYTPDAYNFLEDPAKLEGKLGESVYDTGSKAKVYDKQTGVLKPNVRITSLPKNGYVDLNFDGQNFSNLEKALVDINTAESVRQVSGYIYSDAFKDIVTDRIERQALIKRIEEFVAAKRKVGFENKNTPANLKKLEKTINFIAQTAVSRTLGSLGQVPKQLAPLVNTLFNAGPINTLLGISLTLTNPKVKEFLKKSGRNIATRGLESSTQLDNNNTRLEKSATGGLIEKNTQKFFRNLSAVQKGWLNELLVKPDKFAANASWIAYYLQNMEKQKKDPNNIDWNTHKINNEAADYAQYQVDRQQNVSDRELQGKILRSNNFVIKNAVRIVLPFSNFLLNQKSRMYADVQTVFSLSAGKEDKVTALRSLTGLAAETYTFQTLGYVFTNILAEMSALGDEDEEEKEKMKRNRIKGKIGTVAKDIFSPIPLPAIDDAVIGLSNKIIEQISNDDEDASLLFEERASKPLERLGLYSIGVEKAKVAYDLIKIGQGKEIEDDYGNLMSFGEQERILAKNTALFYVPYLFGVLPGEAGTIGYYNLKAIKKNKIKKSRKKKEY